MSKPLLLHLECYVIVARNKDTREDKILTDAVSFLKFIHLFT